MKPGNYLKLQDCSWYILKPKESIFTSIKNFLVRLFLK